MSQLFGIFFSIFLYFRFYILVWNKSSWRFSIDVVGIRNFVSQLTSIYDIFRNITFHRIFLQDLMFPLKLEMKENEMPFRRLILFYFNKETLYKKEKSYVLSLWDGVITKSTVCKPFIGFRFLIWKTKNVLLGLQSFIMNEWKG